MEVPLYINYASDLLRTEERESTSRNFFLLKKKTVHFPNHSFWVEAWKGEVFIFLKKNAI